MIYGLNVYLDGEIYTEQYIEKLTSGEQSSGNENAAIKPALIRGAGLGILK